MSYNTIDAACEYYLNVLANLNKFAVTPPRIMILDYNKNSGNHKLWLRVTERPNTKGEGVYAVVYGITLNPNNSLGEITLEEYSSLADEIDMAVSEYRRKNFKRISRQQRHLSDEESKERQNLARNRRD